jgi:hypothetical protein
LLHAVEYEGTDHAQRQGIAIEIEDTPGSDHHFDHHRGAVPILSPLALIDSICLQLWRCGGSSVLVSVFDGVLERWSRQRDSLAKKGIMATNCGCGVALVASRVYVRTGTKLGLGEPKL